MDDSEAGNGVKTDVPEGKAEPTEGEKKVEEMAKTLGELKEAIAKNLENRKTEESKKSDAPDAGGESDSQGFNEKVSEKIRNLENELRAAEIQLEALRSGVKMQFVEDAVTLAQKRKEKAGSEFKTIFAELRSKYPDWFGTGGENRGTGSSIKTGSVSDKTEGIGARLAKKQKIQQKKSFWKT